MRRYTEHMMEFSQRRDWRVYWQKYLRGLGAWWEALSLLTKNPSLVGILALPFLLSTALTVWGAATAWTFLGAATAEWVNALTGVTFGISSDWLLIPIRVVIGLILTLLSGWTVAQLAWILTIPLGEWLCRQTARALGQPFQDPPSSWKAFWMDARKGLFAWFLATAFFLLGWIFPVGWLLSAFVLGFQALTFVDTQRRIGLRSSLTLCERNLLETLGLGTGLALGLSLPFLAWIVLPLGVVAATWLRLTQQDC